MKIGYVLKKYPRISETFILNEILELERQGVEVTVFSLHRPDEGMFHPGVSRLKGPVLYLDARTEPFAATLRSNLEFIRSGSPGLLQSIEEMLLSEDTDMWARLRWGARVAIEARDRGLDRLHAHFATVATHVARIAHLISGIPYSFTCHAKDIYRQTVDPQIFRRLVEDADFAVTVCEANRRYLREHLLGDSCGKTLTLYNGVDLGVFKARPDSDQHREKATDQGPLILSVGRLVEKKGFHHLIRAVKTLSKDRAKMNCVIGCILLRSPSRSIGGSPSSTTSMRSASSVPSRPTASGGNAAIRVSSAK